MGTFYIVALIILLVLLYFMYKRMQHLLKEWRGSSSYSSKFITVLGFVTFFFAILFWIFLGFWTIDCWHVSQDPSRPKPYFLVYYFLGLVSFILCMGLSQFFSGINKLKSDSN